MKASPECIPCILRQVLRTARMAGGDEWLERKVLNEIMTHLIGASTDITPAELSHECHRAAGRVLGMQDPYQEERRQTIQAMLALEPRLVELINKEENKLYGAAKLAAAANAFDDILDPSRNIELIFQRALSEDFHLSDYRDFEEDVAQAQSILYVLGSSGELVCDRLFIDQFPPGKKITLVVRKAPILTDATAEDVEAAQLDKYDVIDPGVDTRGVPLEQTSLEFKEVFESVDLVLSKGQANYETLRSSGRECFYLLRTKCDFIAGKLGVKAHNLVFLKE